VQEASAKRPLLIYDGDCAFCAYWARYWQQLTGSRVQYEPYQRVAAQFPGISQADFRRAVQYVAADGQVASAAKASLLTLSHAPGRSFWLALYRQLPGFAPLAELAYACIATHRAAFYRLSLCLWGRNLSPPRYDLVAFLFLRAFGLIYCCAFVSFGVQALGLIGSHGILPLGEFIRSVAPALGPQRFLLAPMVFWWNSSDAAILTVCWGGAAVSLLLACNVVPRTSLLLLHILYLSLLYGGQSFMTYQWDTYLLETGFLALLLSVATIPGIWLLRWLLFRFMFMSGVVKLLSGDPNWWGLSALSYHFFTQPLPTPLAWYAAQLPAGLLKAATGGMLLIELALPFLIFAPRRARFVAAFGILLLQSLIALTGNYNWFNFQTMLLCVILFDDAAVHRILPERLLRWLPARKDAAGRSSVRAVVIASTAALIVFCSLVEMAARFGANPPAVAQAVDRMIEPAHIVSAYGLFAVMTTERDEIIIEGSDDGEHWREYEFRFKPGDVMRRPPWNIPHQPRLDWQMWFAALENPRGLPWFARFLQKLLENDPAVTALLARDPFPDRRPRYIRALFYDYRYAEPAAIPQGRWWNRRLLGLYFPPVELKSR
jgi:predicted DCC family thiol-disulfide oxidoreductase YuxK